MCMSFFSSALFFPSKGHIVADPVGHFVTKSLVIAESKAYESGQERSKSCHPCH